MSGHSRVDGDDRLSRQREDALPEPANATVLQKRQFLNRIAQRTGQRNADIRNIVEATLAELGDAIAAGQTLALPPLGRARINRQKDVSGSEVIILRLRRRKGDIASSAQDEE
ncbi:HU family DNA-binding protein [Paracoccus sp. CPCC 101403]|uniref:HU family DNA-binding protein n=2 Tax=Paracoccus broussonetiae TaxID=3075834 RepID=A0ABU3EK35_9RHOB|nr:HU family DNA-binding protein [Paracoccus sp. CPCC 101403]MDT1063770.1 HU family DNA-binding protein [Paracoccus sp. CPCC 101403]